jgi:peroxin-6
VFATGASLHRPSGLQEDNIFVAICPRTPLATIVEDITWTILCVQKQDSSVAQNDENSQKTIRFPASSSCVRSFIDHLHILDPNRHLDHHCTAVDTQIANVRPLTLDAVYVTVEKNLLGNVDAAQTKFGGGFNDHQTNGISDRAKPQVSKTRGTSGAYWDTTGSAHSRLTKVVREAVTIPPIIHAGDTLALPLPSHPITHTSPPPAFVSACEPVAQGLISSITRIVLVQAESVSDKTTRRALPKAETQQVLEDNAEDTSDEQFYSAAEGREGETDSDSEGFSEQSDTDRSYQNDSDDISDDSLEDMIALRAPALPPQRSGAFFSTGNATPRPGAPRYAGTETPGSLYSSYTIVTACAGTRPGRVCRAEALLQRIPITALHPKPNEEDDDQSFVFVDINTLTKIGCFSGDWVRLEKCKRPQTNGILSLNFDSIANITEDLCDWRPVRIFGLSNLAPRKPRYALGEKQNGISRLPPSSLTPSVYIPPVMLHNLGAPSFVKLSAIHKPESSTSKSPEKPPLAKEVTLRKVSTPMSTKKEVQSSLFAMLKEHFQQRFRILKLGDLIAVPFDEELSKATFDVGQNSENSGEDIVAARLCSASSGIRNKPSLAWFSVVQVVQENTENATCRSGDEGQWGGIAMVDSATTRMAKDGNSVQGIPEVLAANTAIWHGVKKIPQGSPLMTITTLGSGGSNLQPYVLPLQTRLSNLVSSATSPRALSLGLPPLAILLHSTQRQIGKSHIASSACAAAGMHTFTVSAQDILAEGGSSNGGGDVKTEICLTTRAERAFSCGSQHTALLITHLEMLTADRMIPVLSEVIAESRVLIATTTELEKVPDGVRSLFTHELEVSAPNETDREGILHNACLEQALRLDSSVHLDAVALKTAALVAGDLIDVVQRASAAHDRRVEDLAAAKGVSISDVQYSGGPFVSNVADVDFNEAIARARSTFSDSIGAPKIPTVTWKDVGGLADQKSSIMETISLPLTRPELFAKGMRKRSGILFYGPPGTGKTLLAKAIATEFSLNFFSVKGPELLNMYIGESEANVRRVFQRARDARPCVVFFDELDSVAPKRGNQGDSGGVMDRIVSQLLAELDGMSSGGSSKSDSDDGANGNAGGVFVIGATNRPDLLDPALLRPGRFDKMLYLGVSSTHEQQVTILEALTRKFTLDADVDLTRVASRLPFTYTGADLYALCSDAMLKAITKKTKQVDVKVKAASRISGEDISTAYYFDHLATPDDTIVTVGEDDFAAAQKELVASVR